MTTLAGKAILLDADNHPSMLEKDMYDSWKSRMKLYMMNRQHGRMILESVENGPLIWPTIEENGVTIPKKYSELSATEAIQADCDVKATNIILQGLPPEERECKLYDEFDKFAYKKGETLRDFYLIFSLLLNDMNIYNVKLKQFQVNTKFLNTLPPEWSKFVTDVKLVRDLHTTNIDQLHAYLGQHEFHENEVRLMHERNSDPLALLRNSSNPRQQATIHDGRVTLQPVQGRQTSFDAGTTRTYTPGSSGSNSGKQRTVICYNCKGKGHMSKQCTKPKRKRDDLWFKDKVLLVQAQANGQILNEEELALLADLEIAEDLSHYGSDALVEVHNPDNMDNNMINKVVQAMSSSEQSNIVNQSETEINSDSNIIPYSQSICTKLFSMLTKSQFFYDHTTKQALSFQNPFYLKKARQLEPKLYHGNVIKNTSAIVIPDSEETLMLAEESRSKMLLKQQDPMMLEKKVNTTPVDYAIINQLSQDFETRFVPQTELYAKQAF
ncbi:retrovirus-related pol polyprotein from transposon TNT 1-94 [Tanacetum coccineum]|uniref:Retrovirus-related pol polyprotein from transposon TNT 1-94 n=1 Tax=Tanacetum coccineum TaxID=301880 RepID=A0ABQ5A8Y7_9ASTR